MTDEVTYDPIQVNGPLIPKRVIVNGEVIDFDGDTAANSDDTIKVTFENGTFKFDMTPPFETRGTFTIEWENPNV